jgi:tetratricopeptide (TPR) repeat protein
VEGSVRKAGDRVRISAQLIDASTGAHVWAERYDRELRDIFAVQDEITEAIVGSAYPGLYQAQQEHAVRQEPEDLDAYDLTHRGFWHFYRFTKEDNAKARSFFERAAELDPHFADPFVGVAMTHYSDLGFQWSESPEQAIRDLVAAAERSVALDDKSANASFALGLAHMLRAQPGEAVPAFELAIELNPSLAPAYNYLGFTLAQLRRPDEGMANVEKAMRLSPHDPAMFAFLHTMALGHFAAERYEEAIGWAKRSLQRRPHYPLAYCVLAASYARLARLDEARTAVEELLCRHPQFSLAGITVRYAGGDPDFLDRYLDGLRKAGLKE